ncbi:MAG TPA: hypothetical protein VMU14_06235 [Acidimicrobiales bacterium]|nr:hypothetical protein [Acidimicrobiales bacterium]
MSAESSAELARGMRLAGWSPAELWWSALAIGGGFSVLDVEHIITGTGSATASDHDILAATLNDHFTEKGEDHPVRSWADLPFR